MSDCARVLHYKESLQEMSNTKEKTVHMLSALIRGLSASNPVVSKAITDITGLPIALPNRRIKRTMFFKAVEINSPNYAAEGSENLWEEFQSHTFPPHGLAEFNHSVFTDVVEGLKATLDEYSRAMARFDEIVKKANEGLRYATCNQTKSYAAYRALAGQIEETHRKLNTPGIAQKPELEKKLRDSFRELKAAYGGAFSNAVDGVRYLNAQRLEYSTSIEVAFSAFEEADEMVYERVHEIVAHFSERIQSYLDEKLRSFDPVKKSFSEPPPVSDLEGFCRSADMQPVPPAEAKVIRFEPARAAFNLFDFVAPQKLFAKELQYYGAVVIRDYKAKAKGEIDLPTNTIVTVMKTKKTKQATMVKVFTDNMRTVGYVAANVVKALPEMSRQLYRVKENFTDDKFFVCEGDIVLSVRIESGNATCYDVYFNKGTIPVSNLVLFKK